MGVRLAVLTAAALLAWAAPSQARPTVSGTVDAEVAAGRLGAPEAAGYKATYAQARAVLRRLP